MTPDTQEPITDALNAPSRPAVGLDDMSGFEESLATGVDLPGEAATPADDMPAGETNQPAWVGKKLSHFKLLRLIGEGNMGIVVQALDIPLQRIVGLKILRKRIAGVDATKRVEQFLREARSAARIEHPNVIRIFEINQHAGWWYIAMEMIDGENLEQIVKAIGPLPPARVCPIIADAATALAVAHGLGVIHRDVKPTNLMITRGGRCKLMDFGLVRLSDPNDPFDFTDRSVGTPKFVAPELIRGEQATPAVDVYSLGATLYYALTGEAPYNGPSVRDILHQHLTAPVPDVRVKSPGCPESLADLIRSAMAKEPADRPTAADLAASLDAEAIVWRGEGSDTWPGSTLLGQRSGLLSRSGSLPGRTARSRRRTRRLWALAAVIILAAGAVVLTWGIGWNGTPPAPQPTENRPITPLAEQFPNAPATYGVLPPNDVPAPLPPPETPPAFSWVGHVDTAGLHFAASKRGRHYWPLDAPQARLIRRDDFVGYPTAQAAQAAGKTPAQID